MKGLALVKNTNVYWKLGSIPHYESLREKVVMPWAGRVRGCKKWLIG